MKQNVALFLKALVQQGIPYSQRASAFESIFSFDFVFDEYAAQAAVAIFNDENGVRITITDYFSFAPEQQAQVLEILNNAVAERCWFTAFVTPEHEVVLKKEIPIGGVFSPGMVFTMLDYIHYCAQSLLDKLQLVHACLS